MQYKVTIGIPVYNAEQFIGRALDSALGQSFADIEFLILDDCSTDGTLDVVKHLQENHPRGKDIRIVRQPENSGVGAARNRIIDEMSGDYLFFLDSDDLIKENTIGLLYANAGRCSAELVFGSYEVVRERDSSKEPELHSYDKADFVGKGRFACYAFRKYGGLQVQIWNILISRELLRRTGIRFPDITMGEDAVFIKQLVPKVGRAVLLPDITYRYIHRDNSLTNLQKRDSIDKAEIIQNMNAGDVLKQYTAVVKGERYLGNWCYYLVLDGFYMICSVLKKKDIITPALTNRELRHFLAHPLTSGEIWHLDSMRMKNMLFFLLWKLPPWLSVYAVRAMGKAKGLL